MRYQNGYSVALAKIYGGPKYPEIYGEVYFETVPDGVMVYAYITGLPDYMLGNPPIGPFGFHIHEHGDCAVGNPDEPFKACGGHWNPHNAPHGNHAGDFPVLIANNGRAYLSFLTNRFNLNEAIGKAVIIHENPDDYRTQPDGNAGTRIACGVIKPYTG